LAAASAAAKLLPTECNQKITNENQAAELARASKAGRAEVLEAAVVRPALTARAIRETAEVPLDYKRAAGGSAAPSRRWRWVLGGVLVLSWDWVACNTLAV